MHGCIVLWDRLSGVVHTDSVVPATLCAGGDGLQGYSWPGALPQSYTQLHQGLISSSGGV